MPGKVGRPAVLQDQLTPERLAVLRARIVEFNQHEAEPEEEYQQRKKEALARKYGLPIDAFHGLVFWEWVATRDNQ